jgi:hypothetical protein
LFTAKSSFAESGNRAINHGFDIDLSGDVGLDEKPFASRLLDLPDDRLPFIFPARGNHNLCPFASEFQCSCLSQPGTRSRDNDHLPVKDVHMFSPM